MATLSTTGREVLTALNTGAYELRAYTDLVTGVQRRPLQHIGTRAVRNIHIGTFSYLMGQYFIKAIPHTPPDGQVYFGITEHGRAALGSEAAQ
jgi:hypothetical protein